MLITENIQLFTDYPLVFGNYRLDDQPNLFDARLGMTDLPYALTSQTSRSPLVPFSP